MCKVLTLFIATLTSLVFQAFAMDDNIKKDLDKKNISYMERLDKLRHKREKAFHDHTKSIVDQYNIYEKYSKKIGSLLSLNGNYYDKYFKGCKLRKATNHEAQYVLFLIAQTADYFRGMPNAISSLYCLSEERIKNDKTYAKQMAFIKLAHTTRFAIINRYESPLKNNNPLFADLETSFEEWFEEQRQKKDVEPEFKEHIKSIIGDINTLEDQNILVKLIDEELDQKDWNDLIEQLGLVMDIIAPEISLADLANLAITDNYKGWDIHRLSGQYAILGKENPKYKEEIDKIIEGTSVDQSAQEPLISLSYSGILFDENVKNIVKIDDDKQIVDELLSGKDCLVVEYNCFFDLPFYENGNKKEISILFYLTKKLNQKINRNLLSKINDRDQILADHQNKIRFELSFGRSSNKSNLNKSALLGSKEAINCLNNHLIMNDYKYSGIYGKIIANRGYALALEKKALASEDDKTQKFYYKMAANAGDGDIANNYAAYLINTKESLEEAIKYYKKAINKNSLTAVTNYASILYDQGRLAEARSNYKKLADINIDKSSYKNNVISSYYCYGFMVYKGEGGYQDEEEGLFYLNKAHKNGNQQATEFLINKGYLEATYNHHLNTYIFTDLMNLD